VYERKGFDTEAIQQNCHDWKTYKVFGKVYKVDIEYASKEKVEQRIREAILNSIQERKHNPANGKPSKGGRSGAASSARAQPSKGGGRGGGAPKPPPTVATKKMQSDAVKVLAKVSPLVFGMESAMNHKCVKMIPKPHRDKMKSLINDIKGLESAAQNTVSHQALLDVQMATVGEKAVAAQSHLSLFTGMLNSLM